MVNNSTTLTPREQEVLLLLAQGKRTAEIAETLIISPYTAKTHLANIRSRLGARSVAQAIFLVFAPSSAQDSPMG